MTVKDIIDRILKWTPSEAACNSDKLVIGDGSRKVKKVCVCCIATCDVIKQAKEWGAELLITHEPTYHNIYDKNDIVAINKKKLVAESGLVIYRSHDHLHFTESDKIIEGVISRLKWRGNFDGVKKFTFDVEKNVDEVKTDIECNLGLENVRITGYRNSMIKNISMCVGAWGDEYVMNELRKPEIDAVICGEITEYSVCEYVRDAGQMGEKKTLFLLGHMGSERSGMEYVCEYLAKITPEVEFRYIDCGEVY